jgi:hypothetical protein
MNDRTLSIRLAAEDREYLREFLRRRRLLDLALTESGLVREIIHAALMANGVIPDPSTSLDEPRTDHTPAVEQPKRSPAEVNRILHEELGIECDAPFGADDDEKPAHEG